MAQLTHTVDVQSITITVKLPRAFPLRLWLGAMLMKLGARVIGCGVIIEHSNNGR